MFRLCSHARMGAKTIHRIYDFVRWGMEVEVSCANGHCGHRGVVKAHHLHLWFRAHRWPDSLDIASTYNRFRCTACGARAGQLRPTENPVTVTDFFPADDRGWKALQRRLRG